MNLVDAGHHMGAVGVGKAGGLGVLDYYGTNWPGNPLSDDRVGQYAIYSLGSRNFDDGANGLHTGDL